MTKTNERDEKLLIDLQDYLTETDPHFALIGDGDIEKISSILGQEGQNNIIYTGPSGVGKTATLLGIEQRKKEALEDPDKAIETNIPLHMIDRRFMLLDTNTLFDYDDPEAIRNDIKHIFAELNKPGNHVLVIEDANDLLKGIEDHQCYGLISSFIKELKQSSFQTIWMVREEAGANKLNDILDSNSDIRELFTVVHKKEPKDEEVLNILSGRKVRLEEHFEGLTITENAIEEITKLTENYPGIPLWTRNRPARDIVFLDRAASTFVSRGQTKPPALKLLEKEMASLESEIESGGSTEELDFQKSELSSQIAEQRDEWKKNASQLYIIQAKMREAQDKLATAEIQYEKEKEELRESLKEKAANDGVENDRDDGITDFHLEQHKTPSMRSLLDKITGVKKDLTKIIAAADNVKSRANNQLSLSKADVQEIFTEITGISVTNAKEAEQKRLLSLEENLKNTVYGQDESIEVVAESILAAKAGLKPANQPKGIFLLLGSSGVGKSFLAKSTAKGVFTQDGEFDEKNRLKIFDMSEFMSEHTRARLIGAPQGYAGYGKGGELTNTVRQQPGKVILFDEIEKADSSIYTLLLQLLDDGRLSDELGTADFSETVVFFTTNLCQELAIEGADPNDPLVVEKIKAEMRAKGLPQELLNRIDSFLLMNTLKPEHIKMVMQRDVNEMNALDTLTEKNVRINFPEEQMQSVIDNKYKVEEGARQIQKLVQNKLGSKMARLLFREATKHPDGGVINVVYNPDRNDFTTDFVPNAPKEENTAESTAKQDGLSGDANGWFKGDPANQDKALHHAKTLDSTSPHDVPKVM